MPPGSTAAPLRSDGTRAGPRHARRATAARWLIPVLVVVATMLVHARGLRGGFIWDDDAHVTAPTLRSWEGLVRIWTDVGATQQYYPVLHSAFWLEHRLWGDAAPGYHGANVTLHAVAALLVALALRRLEIPAAGLAALLFAVHPVQVESVAWISEQKNTLSAVFYLAALLVYLRFDAGRSPRAYLFATLLFVLGLGTKTVVATLPAALLVIFWWRNGHVSVRRDALPLAPWFLLGAGAGLFTAWVERRIIGAEGAAFALDAVERALLAGRAIWFYAGKLLWPANLSFVYPRWTIDAGSAPQWLPLAAALAVLGWAWRLRGQTRAPLAAALLFSGTLFPVLGFFNVYPFQYSFVADHFQYLATIPVCALVAAGLGRLALVSVPDRAGAVWICAGLLTIAPAVASWQRSQEFHDNRALFRATTERNPGAWMAWNNLGKELMTSKADLPDAIRCFERALALRPAYFEAHNNLGLALTQAGQPDAAIPHLESALRLKPRSFQAHNNLGIALASSGRPEQALASFAAAAAINPSLPNIHENWARALVLLGRSSEAQERFGLAAQLREKQSPSPGARQPSR